MGEFTILHINFYILQIETKHKTYKFLESRHLHFLGLHLLLLLLLLHGPEMLLLLLLLLQVQFLFRNSVMSVMRVMRVVVADAGHLLDVGLQLFHRSNVFAAKVAERRANH